MPNTEVDSAQEDAEEEPAQEDSEEDLAQEDSEEESEESEIPRYLSMGGAFQLGNNIEYLERAASHQYPVRNVEGRNGNYILGTLRDIERLLGKSDLDSVLLKEIQSTIYTISEYYDVPEAEDEMEDITDEDATSLEHSIDTWRRLLKEELGNIDRYPPIHSSLLNISALVENPEILFEKTGTWAELPEQVQDDLEQSARSLAFYSPTGSVFLALRAVEDRLREWYEEETNRDIGDRTFGEVIGELDDQYSEHDRPLILTHLNYLKDKRNKVAHPEQSPTIREAESTLVNVRETILEIHSQLDEYNE